MYQLDFPWLLALLPLPVLVWWLLPPYRSQSASVRIPFFEEVTQAAGIAPSTGSLVTRRTWPELIVGTICWLLVLIALARPQYVEPPIEKTEPQRDLMLAIDLSQSMETKDFRDPGGNLISRIDAVRSVVSDFVKKRPADRIGLIAFGDAPYPLVPFTMDHPTVQTMIAEALPGIAGPRTALGDAIGLAIKMFKDTSAPEKVLIVLTDGNDTASKMPLAKASDIARDAKITIHTIGIGNPQATGEEKLDTASLEKIAATTGGRYFFGQDQTGLQDIYTTLDRITPMNQKTLSWRPRIELFHYPLGAALSLFIAYHLLALLFARLRNRSGAALEPAASQ
ncbi:vWA domain-containing protein [Phyllobacterium pellucidum]|uniref:vWA domain-containing protein n=1 Tax=Phyllobacterium pellucidum TaxID=2740464 RepID=UPI001D1424AF|nr:VWA domain-containing protein [Phyllobacterium sp. T1018]UGY08914.1 VWA domain-containing protein [Phyllobacterium sp. T1018]